MSCTLASASFATTFSGCFAFFSVPLASTSSNILLVDGVVGVACAGAIADLGAIFFPAATVAVVVVGAVFPLFVATFFSFLTSTTFSFVLGFAAAFFTAALLAATSGVVPASSATTFFGRPRFLIAGGSIVGFEDIADVQLAYRLQKWTIEGVGRARQALRHDD